MDADDEKVISEQLEILTRRQQTLQHVAKNQLKVINSSIGHIQELEETIKYHEKVITNATKLLSKKVDGVTGQVEMTEHFYILRMLITDLLTNVQETMEFIAQTKLGIKNTRMLPVNKIIEELKEATAHLEEGTYFPFRINTKNWNAIEQYAEISAYSDEQMIVTIIRFPIVDDARYELKRVTPFPVLDKSNENIFKIIEIENEYIAVDRENNNYLTLKREDIRQCVNNDNTYICEQSIPVYHTRASAPCEVRAITEPAKKPDTCVTREVASRATVWIAVSEPQEWIYSTTKEQTIEIQCRHRPSKKLEINRTGIVKLRTACKLTTTEMTIKTKNTIGESKIERHVPA
ncbi:uncharacterized protein [Cardiocondyla obscurior]|uniref:uncharacterized protein n=1 Tax=Cardiocondyla obscurior TaxID=286306 RepID=UPI00396560C5